MNLNLLSAGALMAIAIARRAAEDAYLRATVESVTLDDWQGIVRVAVAAARKGDVRV
jgi:hypothetical protein